MKIDQLNDPMWGECWRCRHGDLELVYAGDHSRVISFKKTDNNNILFEDFDQRFGRGKWRLLGGHRLWVAPETEASYESEIGTCHVAAEGDRISFTREPGPSLIRRKIEISPSDICDGFRVRHEIKNEGGYPAIVAPWAITCVKSIGRIVIPWGTGAESWRMHTVRYWGQWGPLSTDPASGQWQPRKDRFVIEPRGDWAKIGLASDGRAIAHLTPTETFIKYFDYSAGMKYPDGGCNVQVFTSPEYIELETLGPLIELAGGTSTTYDEHWLLTDPMDESEAWEKVSKQR